MTFLRLCGAKCLPHLAHSQRCRDSRWHADHADSDTSANQRMISVIAISARPVSTFAKFDSQFRDGIETPDIRIRFI